MKFVYERQVFYYETDQMGIVHHSNYIRWFEEARTYLLEQIGIPYAEMEKEGILIPVLEVSSEYRHPVRFGDVFCVELFCSRFNGIRWTFEYNVYNKATGELCNTGNSSHCFLKRDMRPFNMKKAYPGMYEKLMKAMEG